MSLFMHRIIAAFLFTATIAPGALGQSSLRLEVRSSSIVVAGATAKGRVVLFSTAREIHRDWNAIVPRILMLTDTDVAGSVTFEVGQSIPFQSIWVAVDLNSGRTAAGTPTGFPLRTSTFRFNPIHHNIAGDDRIVYGRQYGQFLLVRPGEGAWTTIAADGGAGDSDGRADGVTTIDPSTMRPIGNSRPAPPRFSAHDVVIAIDSFRLEIFSGEVQ
jgi:hypothetical protein